MLRVTVELVPYGQENMKETLGQYVIGNDGTGTREIGNYVLIDELGEKRRGENGGLGPTIGEIRGFERQKPSYVRGWLRLVALALNVINASDPEIHGATAKALEKPKEEQYTLNADVAKTVREIADFYKKPTCEGEHLVAMLEKYAEELGG